MQGDNRQRWVVFTDLDGTLLNAHDYRWDAAKPALDRLRRLGGALVLNSSKTRREMVALRDELGNRHPFVVENGAAIFTPPGYFEAVPSEVPSGGEIDRGTPIDAALKKTHDAELEMELLGPPRDQILRLLHRLRADKGWKFEGFADMDSDAVIRHTGLDRTGAELAQDRMGTEPLLWLDDRHPPGVLAEALRAEGLRLVAGGRFWHAMGPTDKGVATRRLLDRYGELARANGGTVRSIALGDSANDLEMLRSVDRGVWIPHAHNHSPGERPEPGPVPGSLTAPEPGAAGWRRALDGLLPVPSSIEKL
ncbi:MAG: HAD hydrolase family protein [Acidobacteriota bacterium]